LWLLHHPITSLKGEEAQRVIRLLESQGGVNLVFQGTRHAPSPGGLTTSQSGYYEFAAGPLFPGPIDPLCSITRILPSKQTAQVQFFRFDRTTKHWDEVRPAVGLDVRISLHLLVPKRTEKDEGQTDARVKSKEPPRLNRGKHAKEPSKGKAPRRTDRSTVERPTAIRSVTETELRDILSDQRAVLLITAVPTELKAVLDYLKPPPHKKRICRGHVGQETYYVGKYGAVIGIVTMCETGALGRDSVILATQQALAEFKPLAVIMTGIAFGKDSAKQKLGDVLVASQVVSYEQQRVGEKQRVFRGAIAQTGPILLNRFRQALNWRFQSDSGEELSFHVGPLLSGEKLIDQRHYKDELFESFPQAIGGEMEGAGLYAVATRMGVAWIVVKAVCDWADGSKNDRFQPLAAHAAASLVHHVLSDPTVLDAVR
jgi:nucleoside phosphorylase